MGEGFGDDLFDAVLLLGFWHWGASFGRLARVARRFKDLKHSKSRNPEVILNSRLVVDFYRFELDCCKPME
jgi:hypothetical protein